MTRHLLLPVAAAQFLVPALPAFGIGTPIGDAARADYGGLPPEQPLGIAFSIWGVIFTLYAVFAAYAAFKEDALVRRIAPPFLLAGAANVLWMLSAQTIALQLLNTILLAPILYFSWRAAEAFDQMRGMGGSWIKLVADAGTGLLAGWATVAVAISAPLTVRTLTGLGASDYPWQMLLLSMTVAAGAAWFFATRISRSLWYFLALGWGVLNIALNNWFVTEMTLLSVFAAVAGYGIVRIRFRSSPAGSAA